MDTQTAAHITLAVAHPWLRTSLSQLLRKLPAEIASTDNIPDLLTQVRAQPDAILLDPFAFGKSGLNVLTQIRREARYVPVVLLLPMDSPDYRNTAARLGANGIVVIDRADTELLPALRALLARAELVNGVASRLARSAQESAPAGEAAYTENPVSAQLRRRSDHTVQRLSTAIDAPPPAVRYISTSNGDGRVFVHGLALAAGSPVRAPIERQFRTACNLNCGSHFCGLNATVREERIVKIEPGDFPDARYRRLCLKGISYVQWVAHPDRLMHPLKRVGARGAGQWERISWEQALDEIAARMRDLAHRHGPESLMFFPYSGQLSALNGMSGVYLRLASALGASGTSLREFGLDSAVPSGIEDALGAGAGYRANDYADLTNSRLVLIWGANPAQSRMNWWSFFLEAQRGGTLLIDIDPKFTVTAGRCDEWLPVRPGSDLYLALSMLREIIARGWLDRDFVTQHTVGPLLVREDNGHYLEGYLAWDEESGEAVPAGRARCPALTGQFIVRGIACRPAFDLLRDRVERYTPEFAAERTGLQADQIRALAQAYATTKPARIYTLYGVDRWHHGATFGRLIATLAALTGNLGVPGGGAGVDGVPDSLLPVSTFPTPDGKTYHAVNPATLPQRIVDGRPGPITAVWVAFNNWLNQWPDQNRLREEVLPHLDLLVTVDLFVTETARWSDYVLPAASLFEREDIVKGPGPYVQYQPVVVPPPGECRSDFDIASGLAQRLGQADLFARSPARYLSQVLSDMGLDAGAFDALRATGVLQRDVAPAQLIPHYDRTFRTPTGRVEFYVERLLPFGEALPDYRPPVEADPKGAGIRRYPLVCLTEHSYFRVHSTFVNVPWLRELDGEPRAVIHPSAARRRSIVEGDVVRLFNDRGYVVLRAHVSRAVPPGTVYLSQGWQSTDFRAGHAQTLTHGYGNPANALGPNISFSDVLVDVVKEDENGRDA